MIQTPHLVRMREQTRLFVDDDGVIVPGVPVSQHDFHELIGTVVACIEDGIFLHPDTKAQWTHLHEGVLIDTTFGGVVHYADEAALAANRVRLARRQV